MTEWIEMNWLPAVAAAFLIGMMLYGHYRGFLKMALSMAAVLITVIAARMILPLGAALLESAGFLRGAENGSIKLVAFILLFIIIWVVLRIVIKFLDLFTKIPVIHGLNQIAGAAAGLFMGLVVLWMIALVIVAFRDRAWAQTAFSYIAGSPFLSFIFNRNLLFAVLKDTVQNIFSPMLQAGSL